MFVHSINMDSDTLDKLMLGSVYYAVGRMTYIPHIVCNILEEISPFLSQHTRQEIIDYIKTQQELDKTDPRTYGSHLGMDFDKEQWLSTLSKLENEKEDLYSPDNTHFNFSDLRDFWLCVVSAFRNDTRIEYPLLLPQDYMRIIKDNEQSLTGNTVYNFQQDIEDVRKDGWYMPYHNYDKYKKEYDELDDYLNNIDDAIPESVIL